MATLAYNLSNNLQTYLNKLDEYRTELALLPIPPQDEIRLQWEATLERVYWLLLLSEQDISKKRFKKPYLPQRKSIQAQKERYLTTSKLLSL